MKYFSVLIALFTGISFASAQGMGGAAAPTVTGRISGIVLDSLSQ
jgi:hypothetical protein